MVKVDVRHKAPLLEVLFEQHESRKTHGERSFSLSIDDDARHIGYVLLEWESFESARRFVASEASRTLLQAWPLEELLEVRALKDLTPEYAAYRSGQGPNESAA